MSSPPLVEIRDVNFAYAKRSILKGINMTFPKGKVIAVMGGSGCGKTTLLRLIGGALKPTTGSVTVATPSVPTKPGLKARAIRMALKTCEPTNSLRRFSRTS